MRAYAQPYRIYKDRFLLACGFSFLVHILIGLIYYNLPTQEKRVVLRPIALGILQPQTAKQNNQIPKEVQQKVPQSAQQIPRKTESNKQKTNPKIIEKQPLSTDISIENLKPTQKDREFKPFGVQTPSLTEHLKMQADNATFDKLPQRARNELSQLYGTELQKMTKEEKDYLAESYFLNGEVFQQTADRMGYPQLALYLKQQGIGLFEFTLYPDGHVENIRVLESTKFEVLDDSARQLIEQAAKHLKRPPRPITIRLRGNYNIRYQ